MPKLLGDMFKENVSMCRDELDIKGMTVAGFYVNSNKSGKKVKVYESLEDLVLVEQVFPDNTRIGVIDWRPTDWDAYYDSDAINILIKETGGSIELESCYLINKDKK